MWASGLRVNAFLKNKREGKYTKDSTMLRENKNAFTLIEIMIVIIILGIVAGFGLPKYNKAMEDAREKNATTQLLTIQSAQNLYYSKAGKYWVPATNEATLDDINNNLAIGIIGGAATYCCETQADTTTYACHADFGTYSLDISETDAEPIDGTYSCN